MSQTPLLVWRDFNCLSEDAHKAVLAAFASSQPTDALGEGRVVSSQWVGGCCGLVLGVAEVEAVVKLAITAAVAGVACGLVLLVVHCKGSKPPEVGSRRCWWWGEHRVQQAAESWRGSSVRKCLGQVWEVKWRGVIYHSHRTHLRRVAFVHARGRGVPQPELHVWVRRGMCMCTSRRSSRGIWHVPWTGA